MSRTPVEGFYSSCFLWFRRFHIEWTVWNGVNSHNLVKSIKKQIYVFLKICSLSTLSSLFWLARQELSEASEINVWPNGSHHRVHCVCRPYFLDNVGIKTPHQAIRGYTFMQTQTMQAQKTVQRIIHFKAVSLAIFPRLSSFEIHATDESLWKPQLHLLLPRSMTSWKYKMSRAWSNTQTGHLQPLQGVVVVEAVDLPDMQVVLQALPGIQCPAFS